MNRLVVSADRVSTARGVIGNAIRIDAAGTVSGVGSLAELLGPGDTHHEYPGATLVPGIRDAHLHPVPYTAAISGVSLKTAADMAELRRRLQVGRAAAPDRPLVALRLDDETLAERRLPTREDLDAAVDDLPVLVHRYCGHVAVANSAALATAGIDGATADPAGGIIDHDANGIPTGVLRETAIEIVSKALAGSDPVSGTAVLAALSGLTGLGITSVGAMTRLADGPWASLGNEVELLGSIAAELPLTVHAYVIADSERQLREARDLIDAAGPRLQWAGLKRFSDGSLGGRTAAMFDPFSDAPDATGTLRLTDRDATLARACLEMGGSVAIHAIGDRACSRVIDLFEILVSEGADPTRLRLEHASVLTDRDIDRLGSIGVVASVQPAFLASETEWLETRVGKARLEHTYPFRSLLESGVILAAGSDCPVEPPNPWPAMAVARDRVGLTPDQRVSAAEALGMFTDAAACALGEPPPLDPGAPADLVVVDRDPLRCSPTALRKLEVIATYVDGAEVTVDRNLPTWND
jgi:hypothetical protein